MLFPDEPRGAAADLFLLAARLLLAFLFVHEAFELASHLDRALPAMGRLGVAQPVALAAIALQLGAGLAIAIGILTRPAAVALALFCIAAALLFHRDVGNRNELLHLQKDLAIAGGMLALLVAGGGGYALGSWIRNRRRSTRDPAFLRSANPRGRVGEATGVAPASLTAD